MKHSKVGSVMTSDVVQARYGTPFKEIARLLNGHRISGLPVVDTEDRVIGVISETDLMARQAADPHVASGGRHWPLPAKAARRRRAKAVARTAGQLMSRPAITVHAEDTVAEAARTMAAHRVERLPVVDEEERLVGIVTRRDLLQMFLRSDEDIRQEVADEVLVRTLWLSPRSVDVFVRDGVVTLHGQLERRSETELAVRMARLVDGVVAVTDELTFRFDDAHLRPVQAELHGLSDDWMRRL
ncbi:CBS domain-containing protein [Streptomyces sp. TRM66268-LWL]|uniref:CBS domain-containing protein n=1 Tax=Streptomyces polyasparticus TaxID=2767826 RepID=A0ABR7SL59_9ACTN|nr:CBS domain-containing protein [Streptomyces polyasparticus]MBC9715332.1 CBS domain-containing protein [Streptomyces polyasparticus]